MKCLYKIVGQQRVGNKIKLLILPTETEEKTTTSSIMKNPMGFLDNIKAQAQQDRNPDSISIPYEIWESNKMQIGDAINITIEGL